MSKKEIEKFDEKGNLIYYKDNDVEEWWEFDKNNNEIYWKDSEGYERWYKYNKNNKLIYWKDSDDNEHWEEYDENNNLIHYKDADDDKEYWQLFDENSNLTYYKEYKEKYAPNDICYYEINEYWFKYNENGKRLLDRCNKNRNMNMKKILDIYRSKK